MRAEEFVEDNFGTSPKRASRPGARPHRGHEPVPRYRSMDSSQVKEFAPPGGGGGDDGNLFEILRRLAAQWWNGDEDPRAERTLAAMGWEIGQDDGYDNGGVFVVRTGDEHGKSYISWPAEDLESLSESNDDKIAGRYDPEEFDAMVQRVGQKAKKNPMTGVSPIVQRMRDELAQADKDNDEVKESSCPYCGGPAFGDLMLAEKKDACYHKVRSRYKVWPSAYASGALVQCRKKGAKNWGNKS
jgi:hypothetical protein